MLFPFFCIERHFIREWENIDNENGRFFGASGLNDLFIKYEVFVEIVSIALINKMSKYYAVFLGFKGN